MLGQDHQTSFPTISSAEAGELRKFFAVDTSFSAGFEFSYLAPALQNFFDQALHRPLSWKIIDTLESLRRREQGVMSRLIQELPNCVSRANEY